MPETTALDHTEPSHPSYGKSYWSPGVWRSLHSPAWLPGWEGFQAGLSWPLLHVAWLLPALQLERQTDTGRDQREQRARLPPVPTGRFHPHPPTVLLCPIPWITSMSPKPAWVRGEGDQTPGMGGPIIAHVGYGRLGSKPPQGSICTSGGDLQLRTGPLCRIRRVFCRPRS